MKENERERKRERERERGGEGERGVAVLVRSRTITHYSIYINLICVAAILIGYFKIIFF